MKYQIRVARYSILLLYYYKANYLVSYHPIEFSINPDFKTHSFVNQLTRIIQTIENDFKT